MKSVAALTIALLLSFTANSQTYLNQLDSWWKLDEGSSAALKIDAIGNNQLSKVNSPSVGTGIINGCATFASASSQFLTHARSTTLSPGASSFTFQAWVKLTSKTSSHYILGMQTGTGNQREYIMYYSSGTDRYRFFVSTNGVATVNVAADAYGSPTLNTWTHILGWYDRMNNLVNIQVNNGVVNFLTCYGNVFSSTTPFYIGQAGDNINYWDGSIDEVAKWSRVLTTQERSDLYNLGSGVTVNARTPHIILAASNSQSDVQTAVNLSAPGDTVSVPSSTNVYTAQVVIDRNIVIAGPSDGMNTCVIVDNITNILSGGSQPHQIPVFQATWNDTNYFPRITNFRFKGTNSGPAFTTLNSQGIVNIQGNNHQFRLDHCYFDLCRGPNIYPEGFLWGVIDHCYFKTSSVQAMQAYHSSWNGGNRGNGSWADDPYWGSDKFIFFESNTLQEATPETGGVDTYEGARVVYRYNESTNCIYTHHGTEGQGRGGKESEIYMNRFTETTPKAPGQFRSGSALVWSNTWINASAAGFSLIPYRQFQASALWGKSTGTNSYDTNYAGGPFFTGTHTGSDGATTLTDTNATFLAANGMHQGYILQNKNSGRYSYIISNTGTTLTYFLDVGEAGNLPFMLWTNGQPYDIYRVVQSLDQPGTGKGDLKSGMPFLPAAWPNSALEPIYSWGNTGASSPSIITAPVGTIHSGTDFFNSTPKPGYTPYTYPHPLTLMTNTVVSGFSSVKFPRRIFR